MVVLTRKLTFEILTVLVIHYRPSNLRQLRQPLRHDFGRPSSGWSSTTVRLTFHSSFSLSVTTSVARLPHGPLTNVSTTIKG
ncbi:hypothetical protein BV898_03471 [Hypsibius exemplaris]|uniref:Uncharacterized protein n=1 Tax=Hypsibius exemplaris TaxID=2072580 RepID=A0A1W0X546_HYPEX|nr:hypothetical protein BV898_03471 [Hypsibius exemplaris]